MSGDRPTDMREVAARAQIEREVAADAQVREAGELNRDAAMQAVSFAAFVMVCIGLPLLAAAAGAAVRVFGIVSGLY